MKKTTHLFMLCALTSSLLFSKNLVSVNGHQITDSIIPPGYEKLDDTQQNNLLEQLIKEEVLYQDLLRSSLVRSNAFKQAFQKQKALAQEQYKKTTGKGLNKEQLRNIKGAIAVALYQQNLLKSIKISKSDVKEFYNNNRANFQFPNSIEIADIILPTQAEANKILKKLQKSQNLDQDFIETAHQYKQNGYMGWFGEGSAPENLFNAAYKTKGKTLLKKPIKTKHGYNVLYVLNTKKAGKLSFSEVKERIEQMMKQRKVMEKLQEKVDDLYGASEIIY